MRHEVTMNQFLHRALIGAVLLGTAVGALAYAGPPRPPVPPRWDASIEAMSQALARGDVVMALRARESAYRAALAGRDWQGLCAVGDASLRLGDVSGLRGAMEPEARRAYRAALYRARQQGSVDGILHASRAFLMLGDHDVAGRGIAVATTLATAANDVQALERVRALQEQLAAQGRWYGVMSERPSSNDANAAVLP